MSQAKANRRVGCRRCTRAEAMGKAWTLFGNRFPDDSAVRRDAQRRGKPDAGESHCSSFSSLAGGGKVTLPEEKNVTKMSKSSKQRRAASCSILRNFCARFYWGCASVWLSQREQTIPHWHYSLFRAQVKCEQQSHLSVPVCIDKWLSICSPTFRNPINAPARASSCP